MCTLYINGMFAIQHHKGVSPTSHLHYKKGATPLAAASAKVYQLLAHGRWFSPGTPASSTTKTGRHDIAEILLKVTLNTKNHHHIYVNHINGGIIRELA